VNIIGLPDDYSIQSSPQAISVVLNGPQSLLEDLTAADVQAVVDVNGVAPGTTDIVPQISIRQGQVNMDAVNITLLPSRVGVTLIAPTPELTDEPTAEATATSSEP
jgi:YbbR domain-containing protein